ncbi:sensor domain-containing protein [Mycolicibacillus parakoreensis]|uniref:Sensor domain-containing protein n=1 Tax=Mycolicibacillus parakoreensis TaxID=1069221 RepID=A0ABY3U4Y5_9MYCO|nr:sensor domain-containing protein [Mycolicibacillus parakoreensis]MCV7314666.1 sensor domain-containing protein [Mycolicibacillus parakoreensis]ULN53020.1 sensor domain-containing protein [Mycolicibacillus parakoreensis]
MSVGGGRQARLALVAVVVAVAGSMACGSRPSAAGADPGVGIDTVIVDLAQVGEIVADPSLHFTEREHRDTPADIDPGAPGACWSVSNERAVFGDQTTVFRAVQYGAELSAGPHGKGFPTVTQAVGGYRDAGAARGTFDRLLRALQECAQAQAPSYDFTLGQDDPTTAVLTFADPARATVFYRVRDTDLIRVSALALEQSDRIAHQVAEVITGRLG